MYADICDVKLMAFYMCACVYARACISVRTRACVRACVRLYTFVYTCMLPIVIIFYDYSVAT